MLLGAVGLVVAMRPSRQRRRTRVSRRFVIAKLLGSLATLAFVVVFNFFLFRVVATDPVANLFRGRNLTQAQRDALIKEFGLDGSQLEQFWSYLKQTASLNFGRSYVTNEPVMSEIASKALPTIALVGVSAVLSAVFGILIGIAAAWRRGTVTDYAATTSTMTLYSMPEFWLGMLLLTLFGVTLGWFPIGGLEDPTSDATGLALLADQAQHMFLPALTLTLAYLGEYALVMRSSLLDTMREDYLVLARAKGLRDIDGAQPPRGARTRCCRWRRCWPSTSASSCPAPSPSRRSSPGPGSGWPPTRRSRVRTCRCCRASSSCSPRR